MKVLCSGLGGGLGGLQKGMLPGTQQQNPNMLVNQGMYQVSIQFKLKIYIIHILLFSEWFESYTICSFIHLCSFEHGEKLHCYGIWN